MVDRSLIGERTLGGLRAAQAPAAVNDGILTTIARARRERGESVTATARHLGTGRSTLYRAMILSPTAARLLTARDTTQ